MRWPKGRNALVVIILLLIIIGVVDRLFTNPLGFLLPIIIIGGIFLLYKYPPASWKKGQKYGNRTYVSNPRSAKTTRSKPRSKSVPFHVIDGGKDNDDDKPKYH